MAVSYHHRLINKLRSFLAICITSYDPFGEKFIHHFRTNPYYPFEHIQPFTFEYRYRRWSNIYVLFLIQTLLVALAIYSYYRFRTLYMSIDEKQFHLHWIAGSELMFVFIFGILTIFVCVNLVENFKRIRLVLSPLDLHVSMYVENDLRQKCSLNRAYICLRQIQNYNCLLYHLVFIIEDLDLIEISDYFPFKNHLQKIGKRLAQRLYIGYVENDTWMCSFPKYHKLKSYIHRIIEPPKSSHTSIV